MSIRRDLILAALQERFREVCDQRIGQLKPAGFGEQAPFVSEIHVRWAGASLADLKSPPLQAPAVWVESDQDCLTALRRLAQREQLTLRHGQQPSSFDFLERLKKAGSEPIRGFQLLTERYACPLNFGSPEEHDVCEYVLERLMVRDRAKIERSSITSVNSEYLLLKLNLVAIQALLEPPAAASGTCTTSLTTDLRFLDALNYYYELIPADWHPHTQHNWLLVSYLALYAWALPAWFRRNECEQAS